MKTRLLLLFVLLVNMLAAGAQTERRIYTRAEQESMQKKSETKEERAQRRAQEKRLAAIQDSIRAAEAYASLERLGFVLEANRLSFKRGGTAYVTSNTNFISLSDDQATVQIAPFYGGGPNGVGGITLDGRASNIKLKTDKKGNITFSMSVFGTGISATIEISLPKNGYMASATVSSNVYSGRITLYGELVPLEESTVFKGRAF